MKYHLFRIELEQFPANEPLFNHEVVFKTLKGCFHDLKEACLSDEEYDAAGPLVLYRVDRGSGIWDFLGGLRHLVLMGTTLADEKVLGQKLDNIDKRLTILRKHFLGAVSAEDVQHFMNAQTPRELEAAIQRLINQGIQSIKVSTEPFNGNIDDSVKSLVDMKKLLEEADGS